MKGSVTMATGIFTGADRVDWEKCGGLVPAIVQDVGDGTVLMLGYMNREALEATLASGRVTFFSRSKGRLWTKGETSGNWLELASMTLDCDGDALLVTAHASGLTCHLGTKSCFADARGFGGFVGTLWSIICAPESARRPDSYTTKLLGSDIRRVAQKVGEEGVEVALAAVAGPETVVPEAADLVYHLLVLIHRTGATWDEVEEELRARITEPQ